jgi:hypothetical protein
MQKYAVLRKQEFSYEEIKQTLSADVALPG